MTKGPIIRTILKLAVPIMASSFLGTLYNICDMAWVGTLGAKAVAGVGVGGMYLWLASGFATLPRMGGQVLTAQALGAGEKQRAREYTRAAVQMIIAFGILFGAICLLFTRQMVGFFNLTDTVSQTVAIRYIRITGGIIVFNFLNFTLAGLFTADGDSKTPMIANFFGLVLNMIMDPLLIIGPGIFPRMETTGAAIATVLAQMVVTAILLIKMRGRNVHTTIFRDQNMLLPCEGTYYKSIFRIGFPAAIQSMIYCMISMILTRFVSGFGPEAVAVSRVGSQIESVSWNTADGFSSAINAFCGQNFGAKQYDRIKKGYSFSWMITFGWGMIVLLCFMFLPGPISRVFFHEQNAIALSTSYLTILGLSEPFLMIEILTTGALSGLGKTKLCSILAILLTGIRIPLALIMLNTPLGLNGIWWAYTSSSIIKGTVFTVTFVKQKYE